MSLADDLHALRHDAGAVVVARDVVTVDGADAPTFLQGQLSQDLTGLAVGGSAWSLLLQPTGKVDAWLRVCRTGDDTFELDVDAGWGSAVMARLERFKLRVRCDLALATRDVVCVRGPNAGTAPARTRRIVWPNVQGYDLLDGSPGASLRSCSPGALEVLRIAAGVPAMGRELTDRTIPAEAGQWLLEASVSFTKGCYTGQELVARIDARGGNVPRHLRVVRLETGVPVGAALHADGGVAAGTITSVADDPDEGGAVGLAYVPRAVEAPVDVVADADGPPVAGRVVG
jgi:folate-binding protein YgfZ